MAKNISTVVKIFALMGVLLLCINLFIEIAPKVDNNFTQEENNYLLFLSNNFNGKLSIDRDNTQVSSIFSNTYSLFNTQDLFSGGILSDLSGALLVLFDTISFMGGVIITILIIPGLIINMLLYNFIFNNSVLSVSVIIIADLLFYFMLFKIYVEAIGLR